MQAKVGNFDVSRETFELLSRYAEMIRKWTQKINLVAPSQMNDLWDRHILDSYQLIEHVPTTAKTIVDLGSGGGLPGLVLAIHAKAHHPDRSVTLIESDQRKSVFLRAVIRNLDLDAKVLTDRIENVGPNPADVVTARALASLDHLMKLANPLLKEDGVAIFPKGKTVEQELETARRHWQFSCHEAQSLTDINARILVIRDMKRGTFRG